MRRDFGGLLVQALLREQPPLSVVPDADGGIAADGQQGEEHERDRRAPEGPHRTHES